jgi:hypothetical protein
VPRQDTAVGLVNEISRLTARLVETGMVDDQNVVALTLLQGRGWSVAQPGADMSIALKKRPYAEVYRELASTGNYTLHLLDGALVQFSYSGTSDKVERHRLAYLPAPDLEPYQNDPDLYFGEHHFVDIVGYQVMPVPLRFDYDARVGVSKDMVHPVSHVTLGQYQHCRVPATRAVRPSEFVSFVLRNFYSTPERPQEEFVSELVLGFPSITTNEAARAHVALP